ncbi:uncharacterized protein SAMN04488034_101242 [Salinimicrobium catena]|uniref:DUF418 domain-containing protein n=1 Tax=Salinimicrobium catena TaxID=390640 RepID=A0A1H5HTH8_9FLAO|nr:DUF418 domain-containing protein [Salinimicrobium catena]SDK72580.1 uncharacterized protein SAMN04488140_101242 [Salinimicrobium catena]SEE31263.1 uncharacterized protein SAMN04488034_101242 [Salinimicrobium catena]
MENSIRPTAKSKRIDLLDVYRGFALLGIFVVNIVIMNSTFLNQDEFAKQWTSGIDQFAERVLQLFFYTKFFPIFSLLFGLGISMQALKLKAKNKLSFSFFGRRMFFLFLIGVGHILFLWSGDVVHLYALLGLFVTLLLSRSNKIILFLSGFFLLFPFYDEVLFYLFGKMNFDPGRFLSGFDGAEVNRVINHGSYLEGLKLRALEYMANLPMLLGFLAPLALSMFLLGLYLGKNRIYDSLESYITKIRTPMLILGLITNVYRILFLFVLPDYGMYSNDLLRPYFIKAMVLSDVFMGLFYLWIIGWLWYNTKLKFLLKPLRHAGRMALTNYLMQSVIGLLLFSSVGFSLYETMSPSQTLSVATAVFAFQVLYSKLWLSYFKYGPMEWLWRSLTYKKALPITRSSKKEIPEAKEGAL